MINFILKQFLGTGTENLKSLEVDREGKSINQEIKLALHALMIEISGIDNNIDGHERQVIVDMAVKYFGVTKTQSLELIDKVLVSQKLGNKIETFLKKLNEVYTERQKQQIIAIIWKIVIADGRIDTFERGFAQQVRYRLQVEEVLAEEAKRMAFDGQV